MNKVRITAIRQTVYPDLMAKYENPIEHTCDVREGQGDKGQVPGILTLFIPQDSHESRFLSTFAEINRQINRNLWLSNNLHKTE